MDFYLSTSRLHHSRCMLSTAFDNVIFVGNLGVMTWNEMIPFEHKTHLNWQMNIHNFMQTPRVES